MIMSHTVMQITCKRLLFAMFVFISPDAEVNFETIHSISE